MAVKKKAMKKKTARKAARKAVKKAGRKKPVGKRKSVSRAKARPSAKSRPSAKPRPGAPAPARAQSAAPALSASQLIDARIAELGDWRGETLARVRALIRQADPEVVEDWKWDVPVWSRAGIICTGETYKNTVKLTFAKGASVADPSSLFNSSLEGNTRRAIDLHEGAAIDEEAFKALIRAAVAVNTSGTADATRAPS